MGFVTCRLKQDHILPCVHKNVNDYKPKIVIIVNFFLLGIEIPRKTTVFLILVIARTFFLNEKRYNDLGVVAKKVPRKGKTKT